MTTIRTKCPTCGDVDMAADEISLHLTASGERGAYGFVCPECSVEVNKPANRKTVALLIAAGVEPLPLEDDEGMDAAALAFEDLNPRPEATAFTLDDVIAFHFLLDDDAAVAELLSLDA
jgi:hypothetical protein